MPKNSGGGEDRAKVKLRVIEFELEGANSSVENSIRQLTAALTFRSNVAPPRTPPLKETREIAVGAPDDIQDAEVIEDADGTEGTGDLSTESKPAKQTKPKKFKSPEVVNDLDLTHRRDYV
jgi:hypothetical protein